MHTSPNNTYTHINLSVCISHTRLCLQGFIEEVTVLDAFALLDEDYCVRAVSVLAEETIGISPAAVETGSVYAGDLIKNFESGVEVDLLAAHASDSVRAGGSSTRLRGLPVQMYSKFEVGDSAAQEGQWGESNSRGELEDGDASSTDGPESVEGLLFNSKSKKTRAFDDGGKNGGAPTVVPSTVPSIPLNGPECRAPLRGGSGHGGNTNTIECRASLQKYTLSAGLMINVLSWYIPADCSAEAAITRGGTVAAAAAATAAAYTTSVTTTTRNIGGGDALAAVKSTAPMGARRAAPRPAAAAAAAPISAAASLPEDASSFPPIKGTRASLPGVPMALDVDTNGSPVRDADVDIFEQLDRRLSLSREPGSARSLHTTSQAGSFALTFNPTSDATQLQTSQRRGLPRSDNVHDHTASPKVVSAMVGNTGGHESEGGGSMASSFVDSVRGVEGEDGDENGGDVRSRAVYGNAAPRVVGLRSPASVNSREGGPKSRAGGSVATSVATQSILSAGRLRNALALRPFGGYSIAALQRLHNTMLWLLAFNCIIIAVATVVLVTTFNKYSACISVSNDSTDIVLSVYSSMVIARWQIVDQLGYPNPSNRSFAAASPAETRDALSTLADYVRTSVDKCDKGTIAQVSRVHAHHNAISKCA